MNASGNEMVLSPRRMGAHEKQTPVRHRFMPLKGLQRNENLAISVR